MSYLLGFAVFAALLAVSVAGYRASVRESNQLALDRDAARKSSASPLPAETRKNRVRL